MPGGVGEEHPKDSRAALPEVIDITADELGGAVEHRELNAVGDGRLRKDLLLKPPRLLEVARDQAIALLERPQRVRQPFVDATDFVARGAKLRGMLLHLQRALLIGRHGARRDAGLRIQLSAEVADLGFEQRCVGHQVAPNTNDVSVVLMWNPQ